MKPYKELSVLSKCEECDEYPALIRFWNRRVLCSKCAAKSFTKHIQKPCIMTILKTDEYDEIDNETIENLEE